jgi:3-deoxy-D-manno-octulosonic-acid transferase
MLACAPPTRLSWLTHLKWSGFRALEILSDLRGNAAAGHLQVRAGDRPMAALWVFVSTIGELNAIEPLLRKVVSEMKHLKLVLITDHPHYRDGFLARYPQAEVCVTRGHSTDARLLARHYPPQLLVVAEIPCWPSDAPCRFSFAFLREAKQCGAALALVNAWLYHYTPASRMDHLERRWFQSAYVQAFDAICVQTTDTRDHLIAAGASAERIAVAGNIKFDAMQRSDWTPRQARSPKMLEALIASARPTIVAGCVTNYPEQEMLLDAFAQLRQRLPAALLVLAPRHPEVAERMQVLRDYLAQRGLHHAFRTTLTDQALPADTACLVLDTMGELRDFYAAATVSHVGVDHNVLEPLSFGKPVTVVTGWDATYPSYPVYRMLMDAHALQEVGSAHALLSCWTGMMSGGSGYRQQVDTIESTLATAKGAVARHLEHLARWVPITPSSLA